MVKFGTSGLRGLAVDLTHEVVFSHVDAFLRAVPSEGEVLIGQDLRASSPRITASVAAACVARGRTPVDCGVLPTPALALASQNRGLAAVMVTGSHIPADRNGLKFYSPAGEITKADEAAILGALSDTVPPLAKVDMVSDPSVQQAFQQRYADFYAGQPLKGLRIGVYQHSSVARDLLPGLLEAAGAGAVAFERSDSFIPIDTEALDADTRAMLADWTRREGLDAIVSTDGDADRPMLVDSEGNVVPGDVIGPLVAASLGVDVVVTPVSSNTVVELCDRFAQVLRCRIGSPYVIGEMERVADGRGIAGYEANGGFFLGSAVTRDGATLPPLMTRDFALPLLELLRLARVEDKSVAELVRTLPARRTASDRLQDVPQALSQQVVEDMLAGRLTLIPEMHGTIAATDRTDGARFTLTSGRIVHIRPSGNAPELRCYVETEDQALSDALLAHMLEALGAEITRRR